LRNPTKAEIAAFERACATLCALGRKGFSLYLAEDTMNLMAGPSHSEDHKMSPMQENVRATAWICGAGGGDW
jgi:hypothetical protein